MHSADYINFAVFCNTLLNQINSNIDVCPFLFGIVNNFWYTWYKVKFKKATLIKLKNRITKIRKVLVGFQFSFETHLQPAVLKREINPKYFSYSSKGVKDIVNLSRGFMGAGVFQYEITVRKKAISVLKRCKLQLFVKRFTSFNNLLAIHAIICTSHRESTYHFD